MVDSKITALTALTGANLDAADVFEVSDLSDTTMDASGTSKKMTAAELVAGVLALGAVGPPTPSLSLNGTGRYVIPGWRAGASAYTTTGSTGANLLFWYPIFIAPKTTFDRLSIHVNTATASGTARLGIYDDAGGSVPTGATAVLVDGTVSTTTTGLKELTISQTLSGWKWLAFNTSVSTSLRCLAQPMIPPFTSRYDAPNASESVIGLGKSVSAGTALSANPVADFESATNAAAAVPVWLRMA